MSSLYGIPLCLLTDSYKTTHYWMYPEARKMTAYGEFRQAYDKDKEDQRIVFYGMRFLIENYVSKKWTMEDVELSEKFFSTHNAGFTQFPFPKDLFIKFIDEYDGHFPILIKALPEGSVIYPHVPVYQMTCLGEYSRLITYLETVLTMVWYPTTVATLSRRCRHVIEEYYALTVDQDAYWTLDSRLHDFGFRGCTTIEQSIVGGSAHLLNFGGTDTMSAAFYVQFRLNNGKPVATSIPATEHSIMTAHRSEREAMLKLLNSFGSGVVACVMDSYDYVAALEKLLPSIAKVKNQRGGFLVLRPDSGEPVEVILQGLIAADKVFGHTVNKKGYKVIKGASVIQGDGVTYDALDHMLKAVLNAGYSIQNVAFGMGGGLLQKVNRDTMSFATKLCFIEYADGTSKDVMKTPKTDSSKISLPGELDVRMLNNLPMVYPKDSNTEGHSLFQSIYDHGPIPGYKWDDFDTIRKRVDEEWRQRPKTADILSLELKKKVKDVQSSIRNCVDSGAAQGI